jgi:hypothetical protein
VHQIDVNGQAAGEPIDFYHDGVAPMAERELGVFELSARENRLGVRVIGCHEKAVKGYMFGLDYLRIEPAASQ